MKSIVFIGRQELMGGRWVRLFNLQVGDKVPTFGVAPGQDLKQRVMEIQAKFGRKAA